MVPGAAMLSAVSNSKTLLAMNPIASSPMSSGAAAMMPRLMGLAWGVSLMKLSCRVPISGGLGS